MSFTFVDQYALKPDRRNFGLDLIRTIAISLVLISHYGGVITWNLYGGYPLAIYLPGYFGVELFFVLSGFLIGRIIIQINQNGMTLLAWRRFMLRRFMRTLPAYYVWMLVAFIAMHPQLPVSHLIGYIFMLQNLAWPMISDSWYSVTWSLSIEEWFYFLFSFLILIFSIFGKQRSFFISVLILAVLPLIIRILTPIDLTWDAYMRKTVWTHLDTICYGVIFAYIYKKISLNKIYIYLGLILCIMIILVISYVWLNDIAHWDPIDPAFRVGVFNGSAIAFLAALPAFINLRSPGRWISYIVYHLSTLSYSLYLIHLTFLQIFWKQIEARGAISFAYGLFCLFLSFVCALILNTLVEKPFMSSRPRQISRIE